MADAEQLSRVLYNLIENGQKFTRKGKRARITIHACSDGDFALISVTDNGIGIDPRCAERIFEPLKSLHGPGSDYEGTGIGLSLVRSIAEGHGGKAWLDTSCLSETRFVISIPLPRNMTNRVWRSPAHQLVIRDFWVVYCKIKMLLLNCRETWIKPI